MAFLGNYLLYKVWYWAYKDRRDIFKRLVRPTAFEALWAVSNAPAISITVCMAMFGAEYASVRIMLSLFFLLAWCGITKVLLKITFLQAVFVVLVSCWLQVTLGLIMQ